MITSFSGKYAFLSNFAPVKVWFDGATYPTVEHAYQAAKTLSAVEQRQVRLASSPGKAKRLGKKVTLRSDWDEIKLGIMRVLIKQKFRQEPYRTKLIATWGHKLYEGNTWGDKYWGCVYEDGRWVGENHLGKILMEVRDQLV